MLDFILKMTEGLVKVLFGKNQAYYKLVTDFRNKLPRPQNEGKVLNNSEISEHPYLPKFAKHVTTVDLDSIKTSVTEQDLDVFINRIRHFEYRYMLWNGKYQAFSNNILRLKPELSPPNTDFYTLIIILNSDAVGQLKPMNLIRLKLNQLFHSKN
jgi:hypothetical protein